MNLIKAHQKDELFLQDVRDASTDDSIFHIWWLGQSGFLIKWGSVHVLLDPYLSDSLTIKYANTEKPHIRMSELVIDPGKLDFIDVVTSSHNHTDHLDAETLKPLIAMNTDIKMIGPEANRAFIADRIGVEPDWIIGLNEGKSTEIAGITFHGIPAAHNELERDEHGNCRFMGYVLKFGKWTLYHSGDTLWHVDILNALSSFKVDIALLPINGNKPERKVAGNLHYVEAVQMSKLLRFNTLIPCHYDMFTFNTEDVNLFVTEAKTKGINYHVFKGGERLTFD